MAQQHTDSDTECPCCRSDEQVVQAGKDSCNCEDCGIFWVPEDLPRLSSLGFDFYVGDEVVVDWSEGQGPVNTFSGDVEKISVSAGDVIVSVQPNDDVYPEGSIISGTHDCAPEWIIGVK